MAKIPALSASTTVAASPEEAFRAFTEGFGSWWPAEFTWSQPGLLESIGMDCRPDGLLSETGPYGFRVDWGRVVAWEPPTRLAFTWQISADRVPVPDPAQASTVVVTVSPGAGGTEVAVTHDDWHRHGEGAGTYRDQLGPAWAFALDRFRQHLDR